MDCEVTSVLSAIRGVAVVSIKMLAEKDLLDRVKMPVSKNKYMFS